MLKILILIKREIYDYAAYFLGAMVFSILLVSLIISESFRSDKFIESLIFESGLSIAIIPVLTIGFSSMGISQMYIDRTRRISAYLSTLSINRSQILISKICTGVLAILTFFLPVAITCILIPTVLDNPVPTNHDIIIDILITSFLISLACYSIGLQVGYKGKIFPIFGGIALSCLFVTVVIIKGFDMQIIVVLIPFIIASFLRVGYIWKSKSL
jgi:hypothetical protein